MPCLQEIEKDSVKRARLMDSLSRSFPSSALSKALHNNWDENIDPLSSSCFASIRLDKFSDEDTSYDDELTSLAWLQDANLLKNITPAEQCLSPMPMRNSAIVTNAISANVPYDPLRHIKHKPPYSFSCLIFMAIENSLSKRLPVKGIYDWIVRSYPYFQTAPDGWKNSVRHNLSLNKCFKKVERDQRQGLGKGSSWCIDPKHRPNLLQALRRTPYHPFQQLQMVSSGSGTSQTDDQSDIKPTDEDMIQQMNKGKLPSRELFPFLNRHLCQVNSSDASSDTENNDVMRPYSIKWKSHASNRSLIKQKLSSCSNIDDLVCTSYPSADHTYSIPEDVLEEVRASSDKSSSVDEGLDCGSDSEDDIMAEEDQIESDDNSDIIAATDTRSASSVSIQSDRSNCTAEAVGAVTLIPNDEEGTIVQAVEGDDQEKRNFFAAMALIEMSSSAPQNASLPKMISKRRRKLPAKLKEASEFGKKTSRPRVKVSERRPSKAKKGNVNMFQVDGKVSGKRKRFTDDNGEDNDASAVKKQDSRKRPRRIQKQLLSINSSLWGVRRKLPDLDSSLESPPKNRKTVKKRVVAKKLNVTKKQTVTRSRRK